MSKSLLRTKVESTPPTDQKQWTPVEAAVELLLEGLATATPPNTTADPGSDSTKAVAVQGVTGGKDVPVVLKAETSKVIGTVRFEVGELHVGEVSTPADVISVTPVCDTNIYASGDVLFNTTAIPNAVRVSGGQAILQNLIVVDGDDNTAAAMTVFIFGTATSLTFGTTNDVPSISDANAAKLLGVISIASGDWIDLGGVKVANVRGLGILCESSNVRELGFAATTSGTPTQTASGLVFRFGFLW